MKKKVLVTGASGFVGGRLCEYLQLKGTYEVLGTGRSSKAISDFNTLGVNYQIGDLTDASFAKSLVEQVDIVVHAAALSAAWGSYDRFYQANVLPTQNLLDAARSKKGLRFVQISSSSVYVQYKDQFNLQEDTTPNKFINHYAATKYEADQRVLAAVKQGLEAIILRPRAIYGRGDYTIMPRVLRAYEAGRLKVIGKGENWASMTSIQNFCQAIELAISTQNDAALGEIFNISNAEPVKLWEMVELVFAKLELPWQRKYLPFWLAKTVAGIMEMIQRIKRSEEEPVLTQYGVSQLYFSNTFSIEKAQRLLGYVPKQDNVEGIEEFANWWKSLSATKSEAHH
jgi:nucleoside-diphosphate-sugar epimerase